MGQFHDVITGFRVSLQGEDLAVDSKITNPVVPAKTQSLHEGVGIGQTNVRQPGQFFLSWKPGKICCRCSPEFNGLFLEYAA
jgi:hypothetical protein